MLQTQLRNIISKLSVINLKDVSKVAFFERIDQKYVLNATLLPSLLTQISDYYYIMQVNNSLELNYHTFYYDTKNFLMYNAHHNKIPNRFKIRIRQYLNSGDIFLEIKIKKKGIITSKKRMEIDEPYINKNMNTFIEKYTAFNYKKLFPAVSNTFTRLFLVAKDYNERVTIDINLNIIGNNNNYYYLNNIAIIEIKNEKSNGSSVFHNALKNNLIRPTDFSKYCIGIAISDNTIKHNRFKKNLLLINKIQNQSKFNLQN